jgi:CubicO group peptidase (beta-lactamase class C family)
LSKPVFAAAVLTLGDDGRLDLDRHLADYLPVLKTLSDARLAAITARQVLSHSTGLQNWRFELDDPLHFAFDPGQRFAYSGEGYVFLQRAIEQVTGQGFEAFMQARMLAPLGMKSSSYLWLPEHETTISTGHRSRGEPAEPWNAWQGRRILTLAAEWGKPSADWHYEDVERAMPAIHADLAPLPNNMIPNAAGSLLTTAAEYARFLGYILNAAATDEPALSAEMRQAMMTPQIHLNSTLAWGLGWGLAREQDRLTVWHWGENGLFQNFVCGDPASRSGLVILTNSDRGLKVCQRLVDTFLGYPHPAFLWL